MPYPANRMWVVVYTNGKDKQVVGPYYTEDEANMKVNKALIKTYTRDGVAGMLPYEVLPLSPVFWPWNQPEEVA